MTWSAGGTLNNPHYLAGNGAGTLSAGLVVGCHWDIGSAVKTEEYNGTTWAEGGDATYHRVAHATCGTQTAAIACNGYGSDRGFNYNVISYNGTAWANEANNVTGQTNDLYAAATGTPTATMYGGGSNYGGNQNTFTYNGVAWSNIGPVASGVGNHQFTPAMCGTQSACLITGGLTDPYTDEYNGVSWSYLVSGDHPLGTGLYATMSAANGTLSSCISFGGYISSALKGTYQFNGTSWSYLEDMATARYWCGGGGNSTTAFCAGNADSTLTTEEWNGSPSPSVGSRMLIKIAGELH